MYICPFILYHFNILFQMKKVFFLCLLVFFAVMGVSAQSTSGAAMTFEQTEIDYGKIEKGSDRTRIFKFKNTGDEPLIIQSVKGSCRCVVPTYAQATIMPGETSEIKVDYDTNREGLFTKTVTINTNEANYMHTLTITGEVLNK